MTTDELRESFLSFFESKGCVRRPSDLLAPENDPSVLFTPAGMNQFKEQFLGIGPKDFTRATTCQKCMRTADIENVGKTRFHLTFFEMLGNFSFGDYFKRESILWAWEYCTRVLGLAKESLSVTVYLDDDEAYAIWRDEVKVPASRIRRCGEDQNFWPASAPSEGPNGVCGPCSEIYVDVAGGEVEIWNLVFTQFLRVGFRQLEPLPNKNIDTGMGLERAALVLQGVDTVFDIDIFRPIVLAAADALGVKYDPKDAESYRIRRIAEHARSVVFCLHEGIAPSNEKQGYVVRRLLRRAVLDAYQLGRRSPLLHALVPAVVEAMKRPYPELAETAASTAQGVRAEEERFLSTVEQGIAYFDGLVRRAERAGETRILGADAFKLHATYGFPFELTEDLAKGRGIDVDRAGFEAEFAEHRKTSGSGSFSGEVFHVGPMQEVKRRHPPTEFVGYDQWRCEAKILAVVDGDRVADEPIRAGRESPVAVVLDRTPFYGESGGQVGDSGVLRADGLLFEVEDAQKVDSYIQHIGRVVKGEIRAGLEVTAEIDAERRRGVQRAHSATHILHWALHEVLGKHATQAGSKVEADVLRFDFHHGRGMSPAEIERVERLANERIMSASAIEARIMPIAEARRLGATALFGEKYGDMVRVVSMGDFSREFCGGCHLSNTGQAGPLKILREESISAGTRRITAATGLESLRIMREQSAQLSEAAAVLKSKPEELANRVAAIQRELKELQKAVEKEKQKQAAGRAADLLSQATVVDGARVIAAEVEGADGKSLQSQVNQLQAKGTSLAVLLAARNNGKVEIVTAVSDDLVQRGMDASAWIRAVAEVVGGKGGGKPQMARAGGTQPEKLPEALALAVAFARRALG